MVKMERGNNKISGWAASLAVFMLFVSLFAVDAMRVPGAESSEGAPVRTVSFATQVYDFEKLLEAENEVLSFRDAAREAAPEFDPAEPVVNDEGEETFPGPTREQFLADIRDSYESRLSVVRRFSDFTKMSRETYLAFCALCAEAERPFYDAYSGVEFANKNDQVLCRGYLSGLEKQYEAAVMAQDPRTEASAVDAAYFEGYVMRSDVLLELNEFYYPEDDGLEDIESLSGSRDMRAIIDNAREYNQDADSELTLSVQKELNALGFDCGEPDGIAGTNTALAICHSQRSRGREETGYVTQKLDNKLKSLLPAPETEETAE